MCIRDRTRVRRGAKIDSLVQVGHACEVGEDNIICSQTGLAAVSYTHLRAHETVLDIVCRLLLEKKKSKKKKTNKEKKKKNSKHNE